MGGEEVGSRSEDAEGFDCTYIAVLEVNEPARDFCVCDSGDDFL